MAAETRHTAHVPEWKVKDVEELVEMIMFARESAEAKKTERVLRLISYFKFDMMDIPNLRAIDILGGVLSKLDLN